MAVVRITEDEGAYDRGWRRAVGVGVRVRIFLVSALLLVMGVERAHGELVGPIPWKIDSSQIGVDRVKPRRPEVHVSVIRRGRDPREVKASDLVLWCEDNVVGWLVVGVHGKDDRTPPERLGYRLRLAGGQLPRWFELPKFPVMPVPIRRDSTAAPSLELILRWRDWNGTGWPTPGPSEHVAALRFGLLITCVDAAGNESKPSDTLWIADPGR